MKELLLRIWYLMLSIALVFLLVFGGAIFSVIGFIITIVVLGIIVISFIAYCIRDIAESRSKEVDSN